jgi:uncharacterized membrane protein
MRSVMRARSIGMSTLLGAAALGGLTMFLLDPETGRRRRGLARDRVKHLGREAQELVDKGSRDLRHRAVGAAAELRRALTGDDAPDEVLVARVRAEVGRVCSHPHAIAVTSDAGIVTLSGPILRDEADEVTERAARTRGVRGVRDGLARFETPEHVPALQGEAPLRSRERAPRRWTPARRLVGGATGAALLLAGLPRSRHRTVLGRALGAAGALLLARAAANAPAGGLVGLGPVPEVELQKALHVEAPVGEVFALLTDLESYPRFMQHVRRVNVMPEGRSRWTVDGPAGLPLEWEVEITERREGERVAWKTVEGSPVQHAGFVRLTPWREGTRLELKVAYRPAAGLAGRALATLLGASPKHSLDEDMLRFKSLLERGKTSAHGRTVSRSELARP